MKDLLEGQHVELGKDLVKSDKDYCNDKKTEVYSIIWSKHYAQ